MLRKNNVNAACLCSMAVQVASFQIPVVPKASAGASVEVLPNGPVQAPKKDTSVLLGSRTSEGHLRTGTHDRWCAEAQLTSEQIGLRTNTQESGVAKFGGYCYYLAKKAQSCADACMEQIAGQCDAYGTEFAAESVNQCQRVVAAFGGLPAGLGVESDSDRAGCTWQDVGTRSKVQTFKKDGLYPLCSETHDVPFSHRICACTPTIGDFKIYEETKGTCKLATGESNKIRSGLFRSANECQDECTRDSNCGAYAYVHPWDGDQRVCNFYGTGHTGDSSNRHIKCFVKDDYLETIGRCKKQNARHHDQVGAVNVKTKAECQAACDNMAECKAFQTQFPWAADEEKECLLLGDGHTGDGISSESRCYTKAMGGVQPR